MHLYDHPDKKRAAHDCWITHYMKKCTDSIVHGSRTECWENVTPSATMSIMCVTNRGEGWFSLSLSLTCVRCWIPRSRT